MNRFLITCLLLLLAGSGLRAQVQYTTERPRVDDVNDTDVTIKRVELTDKYTIIYMTHNSPDYGNSMWRHTISFQSSSRLYVNQGEKSYRFIRAENIPTELGRPVHDGERVDFVAYFERIDSGYTTFDLFECKNKGTTVCFNFWGVHIINPRKKDAYAQRTPKAPVQPKIQPRIVPPVPNPTPKPAEPARPQETAVAINGVTRDAKTKQPVVGTVTYQLISGAEASGDGSADSVQSVNPTGKYQIPIDRRGVYAVTASARGYFSQSDTLATNRVDVTRDFNLVPIEAGAKVTLKNIYFNVSKYDLKPESFPELDRLVGVMQTNPGMQIRLEGHTDTVGDFDANVELSRNRVNEVKRYLVDKGISNSRIETVGYGPSRPINTNKTIKERPENRRVEMVIVKV